MEVELSDSGLVRDPDPDLLNFKCPTTNLQHPLSSVQQVQALHVNADSETTDIEQLPTQLHKKRRTGNNHFS